MHKNLLPGLYLSPQSTTPNCTKDSLFYQFQIDKTLKAVSIAAKMGKDMSVTREHKILGGYRRDLSVEEF